MVLSTEPQQLLNVKVMICFLPLFIPAGFGPFGEHDVNASWVAVQELERMGLGDDVDLVTKEVPVIYDSVDATVPTLWKEYDPVVSMEFKANMWQNLIDPSH